MTRFLRWLPGVALLLVAVSCAPSSTSEPEDAVQPTTFDATADSSFIIVPGVRIGPIHSGASEEDLIAAFGAENVRRQTMYLTEAFCTLGTRIFPGTPDELEIAWRDSLRTRIAMVRFEGEGARWHTASGVRIGTTLKELESIANEVIEFSGFGWDLAGGCEWGEPGDSTKTLGLHLAPDASFEDMDHPLAGEVYGPQVIRSDHPAIRAGTVRVDKVFQNWGWPYVELECF